MTNDNRTYGSWHDAAQGWPLMLAACYLAGPAVQMAQAAPTLPQVVNGQATFNQQGSVFSITNTPGTIINWQSFNIGAGEITRFIQQKQRQRGAEPHQSARTRARSWARCSRTARSS
jgi:large exoprotein involved in heme utilization and adhesion